MCGHGVLTSESVPSALDTTLRVYPLLLLHCLGGSDLSTMACVSRPSGAGFVAFVTVSQPPLCRLANILVFSQVQLHAPALWSTLTA